MVNRKASLRKKLLREKARRSPPLHLKGQTSLVAVGHALLDSLTHLCKCDHSANSCECDLEETGVVSGVIQRHDELSGRCRELDVGQLAAHAVCGQYGSHRRCHGSKIRKSSRCRKRQKRATALEAVTRKKTINRLLN